MGSEEVQIYENLTKAEDFAKLIYADADRPRRKTKQYSQEALENAVTAIKNGSSMRKAAKEFGIPLTTVFKKIKDLGAFTSKHKVEISKALKKLVKQSSEKVKEVVVKEEIVTDSETNDSNQLRKRLQYDMSSLKSAILAIQCGAPLRAAGKYFGIPIATLTGKYKIFHQEEQEILQQKLEEIKRRKEAEKEVREFLHAQETRVVQQIVIDTPPPSRRNSNLAPQNCCCTCLTQESLINVNGDVVELLKNIFTENIEPLTVSQLQICDSCHKMIKSFQNFLKKSSVSLSFLKSLVQDQSLNPVDKLPFRIKTEPGLEEVPENSTNPPLDTSNELIKTPEKSNDAQKTFTESEYDEETENDNSQAEDTSPEDSEVSLKPISCYCSLCEQFYQSTLADHQLKDHCQRGDGEIICCLFCKAGLRNEKKFLKHFEFSHVRFKDPVKCFFCSQIFLFKVPFISHVKAHRNDFTCDYCRKRFPRKYDIKEHLTSEHMTSWSCRYCNETFTDYLIYKKHVRVEEKNVNGVVCNLCGVKYKNEATLTRHQRNCKKNTCEVCSCTFDTPTLLDLHMKYKHNERKHLCSYCGKKFVYQKELAIHISLKHESDALNPVDCRKCGKKLPNRVSLSNHMRFVHTNRVWNCKDCGKAFKSKPSLEKHIFSHLNGKRPYNCHLCSTGYYMIEYLRNHYVKSHDMRLKNDEVHKYCIRIRIDPNQLKQQI